MCNALTTVNLFTLDQIFRKHQLALIEPLCAALARGHEVGLIKLILLTLSALLQLDEQGRE